MRLTVDGASCMGHGRCYQMAPDLLKLRRVVLGPKRPSRYGKLRREPRSDGLSTIEAAGMLLARLERKPEIETALQASFERLLARYREVRPVLGAGRRR